MLATVSPLMARGRPPSPQGTKLFLLNDDVGEMISWIIQHRKKSGHPDDTVAKLLDPIIRPEVTAIFESIRPWVEKQKRLDASIPKQNPANEE